jgi:hypothetical protein
MIHQHTRDIVVWFSKKSITYCIPTVNSLESAIGVQLHIEVVPYRPGLPILVKSEAGITKLTVSLPSQATYRDCEYSEKREESYLR